MPLLHCLLFRLGAYHRMHRFFLLSLHMREKSVKREGGGQLFHFSLDGGNGGLSLIDHGGDEAGDLFHFGLLEAAGGNGG